MLVKVTEFFLKKKNSVSKNMVANVMKTFLEMKSNG